MHTELDVGIMHWARQVQEIALIVVILLFVFRERVVVFGSWKDSIGTFTLERGMSECAATIHELSNSL